MLMVICGLMFGWFDMVGYVMIRVCGSCMVLLGFIVGGLFVVRVKYKVFCVLYFFFFSSRRRHTRLVSDWSSVVCSSDLKVLSKAELDAAESKFNRLNAVADQMRSNIRKKTIIAPFDGQLGIRQVNVGQMINSGQQVVPLTSLDSLFVDFALPQQYLGQLTPGLEVHVTTDAIPGRVFNGKLTAINSMVDSRTRNRTLQATLENPDHVLRPGMFAKAEVMLPEKHKTLVVPGSAISYAPFGDSVFVIEKKKDEKTGKESQVIRQQFVRVGEGRGDLVAITQGLKAGETIVSTGVFKLRNGMSVTINNDLAPNPQVNPNPIDS